MVAYRFTVSALNSYLGQVIAGEETLQDVSIEGEISDFRLVERSGHAYFVLKDANAQLNCAWFGFGSLKRAYYPAQGDQVIAAGRIGFYEGRGQLQLYCRSLTPAGRGDLNARYEALKSRLLEEGLFEQAEKAQLRKAALHIGVVTSPEAAAWQDVLTVLRRRFPLLSVTLSPAPVQGQDAPPRLIEALSRLLRLREGPPLDAILIVRGGGSPEDLWCFNDEDLVRLIAAAAQHIPLITGIGHEIDFTLADFAASLRAPTPSAAAELVTPVTVDDLRASLAFTQQSLHDGLAQLLAAERQRAHYLARTFQRLNPQQRVDSARQRLDALDVRLGRSLAQHIALRRAQLEGRQAALNAVGPTQTLARGYAILYDAQGAPVHHPQQVRPGSLLTARLAAGRIHSRVEQIENRDEG